MPFNRLPPELTIAIAESVDPFSSFDFALTCKANWKLCDHIITKHKRLFAENSTIDARDPTWPYEKFILWDKLKEILDDPSIGEYVRDISLPSERATYLEGDASHDFQLSAQPLRPPQEDLDRYAVATRKIEDLYGSEFDENNWNDWILKGSSEPIIVMLLHYVPYIKTFRFTDLEMSAVFMPHLQIIAKAYNDPILAPRLPFQHLTTVAVAHWDTEMSCDSDWCLFFCAIPTVRNFVANAMGGGGDPDAGSHRDLPTSHVTELLFHYSRFETSELEAIVRNAPQLEKFSYEVGDATVSESVTPTPKRDLKVLVDHVGHSLQHLVFEYPGIDYDGYVSEDGEDLREVSLRGFHQLKTLRIEWRLLWPNENAEAFNDEKSDGGFYQEEANAYKDFDVRKLLPVSLEKLYLIGSFTSEEMEDVQKIRDSDSELTPLLNEIYISDRSVRSEDEEVPGVHANPLMRYLQGQGDN